MRHDDTSAMDRDRAARAGHPGALRRPTRRQLLGGAVALAALGAALSAGGLGRDAMAVGDAGERTARLGGGLQLLMVDDKACIWCRRWDAEVADGYRNSPMGRIAPLVRRSKRHRDLAPYEPLAYTPTFLLLRDAKEIGRIVGYSGPDFFWTEIERLLAKAGALPPEERQPGPPSQPRDVRKDDGPNSGGDAARHG